MERIARVGFVGLGIMGRRMAMNLAKKGFQVVAWNRTPLKNVAELEQVTLVESPQAVASASDALCTCVADPRALEQVTRGPKGLFAGARRGQLFIDFSTVSAELSMELERECEGKGVDFVEAPVTGSKLGAEKGTLVIMSGASPKAFERAQPIFAAVGERAIHCGPVGAGSQVKLAGNALIAMMLQGLCEGMLLSKKAGVDPRKVLEVVQASGFRSPYYDFKGGAVLRRDFDTHFSIDLMFKDLMLFLDSAAKHRVPAPAVATVKECYALARAAGHGGKDIAATIVPLEDACGVQIL